MSILFDDVQSGFIWHKKEFAGHDLTVDLRVTNNHDLCNDVSFLICSDGTGPHNGYAFEVDAGHDHQALRLLRNGTAVAIKSVSLENLADWTDFRIQKVGDALLFWAEGIEEIQYCDEYPLTGKRLGFCISGSVGEPVAFDDIAIYAD
ncbi:hypothetical protein ACFLQW_02385 [Candidatus Zixiibacteriota bacterium]